MLRFEFPAPGLDILECRRRLRVIAQALHINGNAVLQFGQIWPGFQHLVGLFLIFADRKFRVAVLQDIGHLVPGTGGIDPDTDALHQADAHLADDPLHPVFRDNGHVATRFEPHGTQP